MHEAPSETETRSVRERLAERVALGVTIAAVVACALVFLIRAAETFHHGRYTFTSGLEGAGILGVLKTCAGESLYGNLATDPNGYIFNFLFYLVYGSVTRLSGACDVDAILLARGLSGLTALAAAALVLWYALRSKVSTATALLLASASVSPFIGWWAFAIRPDIGGYFLALVAVFGLVVATERGSATLAVGAILASALSYGFKQPNLVLVAATTVILIVNARGARMRIAATATGAAVAGLIVAANTAWPDYYTQAFVVPASHQLRPSVGIANLTAFVAKALPYLVLLVLTAVLARRASWGRLEISLAGAFLGFVAIFGVAASKVGASDNYYFPALAVCIALIPLLSRRQPALAGHVATMLSAAVLLASSLLVALGGAGRTGLDPLDQDARRRLIHDMETSEAPRLIIGEPWALPTHSGPADVRLLDDYMYFHGLSEQPGAIDIVDLVKKNRFGTIYTIDLKLVAGDEPVLHGYCPKGKIDILTVIARGPCDIDVPR
ncbi:hypothetical protein OHA_1_00810 [Pleomorphomonas sp. SM30]|uniref:Dolichyl-phosphate-mannose-protein mannosyltransferase n=2 Tax=Oharaeibacter diazotrophicus TaxID=1920512 RepID=A0A4R6RLH4_9HYPH|nr:hypothetical protein EDD54_0701 [Oharaeibacter diazotrophicus]BBE71240.1 hypothetical protein OHA_1_00810 [Pleomorphomonas sp. SM30]GLS77994.1 hypothetical protein GCM10007904_33310 [Oharaeibacter diazotrophicus]